MDGPDEPHDEGRREDRISPGRRKALELSARLYRKLLLVYPEQFQEEYAAEMSRYFDEFCEDSLRSGGLPALLVTWLRTLAELAPSARAERRRALPDTERDMHTVALTAGTLPGLGQLYNDQTIKASAHALVLFVLFLLVPILARLSYEPGLWAVVTLGLGLWAYSTVDAWITARRINAALRTGRQQSGG